MLTVSDLCALWNCHPSHVSKMIRNEGLPHRRIGRRALRFVPEEIEAWSAARGAPLRSEDTTPPSEVESC